MCGIFAVFASVTRPLPGDAPERLSRALRVIRHRGPDASGTYVDPLQRFAVGHVRLSVIDVSSSSDQPMWSACGRRFVVFNGEVYNYLEIRAELEALGHQFRTTSDTEVLLQAIERWGQDAVRRFNGMWAFVYGDLDKNQFLVSRDRWGVKPLYVYQTRDLVVLCSEAKGIMSYLGEVPRPDVQAIGLFMKYGIGGESSQSWFDSVTRFPIASSAIVDLSEPALQVSEPTRYWDYPLERHRLALGDAKEQLAWLLEDASRLRMRSDVPVGLSLSGGIDSGAMAWMVGDRLKTHLQCFTAYFEPAEQSELFDAQRLASLFGHSSVAVAESNDFNEVLDDLRDAIYHIEAAHASPAIVPYLRLCRRARRDVTVMLEGQGSDELLAGYGMFSTFAGLDHLAQGNPIGLLRSWFGFASNSSFLTLVSEVGRLSSRRVYEAQSRRWGSSGLLSPAAQDARPEVLFGFQPNRNNLDTALRHSHEHGLTNLLQYGDALSMSVNLETRCPFLDYRLVEFGFSIPTDLLVRDNFGKYILRSTLDPYLPKDVCWRRRKQGFTNRTIPQFRNMLNQDNRITGALHLAADLGIISHYAASVEIQKALPPNIMYRFISLAIWCAAFYGEGEGSMRHKLFNR
jgi:asparagine synthase (glutamine-hydrolysing)